uniref:Uncharacterized protein n=1 Tax=Cyanothece sp. (strain PCC 7425 / ATCC 29141) TaxID=395961 RepID=B8HMY6_CYAP4
MNNTRYNPITAAAQSAWTELTTPEAYEFYDRGWTTHNRAMLNGAIATLEFLVDSAEGWYTAGKFAYQLGIMAWAWFDTFVQPEAPVQSSMLLTAAPCAGYLPEVSSVERPVLVTPAKKVDTIEVLTDRGNGVDSIYVTATIEASVEVIEVQTEVVEDPEPALSPTPLSDRIRANVAASRKTTAEILGCTAEAVTIAARTISLVETAIEPGLVRLEEAMLPAALRNTEIPSSKPAKTSKRRNKKIYL